MIKILTLLLIGALILLSRNIGTDNNLQPRKLLERKNIKIHSILFLLLFIVNFILYILIKNKVVAIDRKILIIIANILFWGQIIITTSLSIFNLKYWYAVFLDFGQNFKRAFWNLMFANLIRFVVSILVILWFVVLFKIDPKIISANQQSIETALKGNLKYILYFQIILIGPFIEEFVFRHYLWNLVSKFIKNENLIIIITGLLFSLMHLTKEILNFNLITIILLIQYLTLGLFLGFIKKRDGLESSIQTHILLNVVASLLLK